MVRSALVFVFFGAVLTLSLPLAAQTLQTGGFSGTKDDRGQTWGWYGLAAVSPLLVGAFDLQLPAGSGWLDWDAHSASFAAVGWTIRAEPMVMTMVAGTAPATTWKTRWQDQPVNWIFDPPSGILFLDRWGPWVFGGADFQATGQISLGESFPVGPFHLDAGVVFLGWKDGGAFLGNAEADADAKVQFLDYIPLRGLGTVKAKTAGVWYRWSSDQRPWSWGIDVAGGLLWVTEGSVSVATQSLSLGGFPPTLAISTSRVGYSVEANPAWGLLFGPHVSWAPNDHEEWTLSRWIPVAGGLVVRQDNTLMAPSPPPANEPTTLTTAEIWNLLLAGIALQFKSSW